MTPAEQNRAIAEWMGWKLVHYEKSWCSEDQQFYTFDRWYHPTLTGEPPNYQGDLNACRQAELRMDKGEAIHFYVVLGGLIGADYFRTVSATAATRCEALLHTLGLWKEGE